MSGADSATGADALSGSDATTGSEGAAAAGDGGKKACGNPGSSTPFSNPVIAVDATTVLRTIPRDIFGMNMAAWSGLNNSGESAYEEAMKVAGVTQIRWPGGSWGDILDWSDIDCQSSSDATTDQEIAFIATFGGKMEPIVNYSGNWCGTQHTHAQAVTLAASWVTYMNVTHSYATKIWEVGNEDYGSWEEGYTTSGTTYGTNFADYYKAMKAVDSSIQVGAVGESTDESSNWTSDVLMGAKAQGVTPDFLIIHEYPYYSSTTGAAADSSMLSNVGKISGWTSGLNQVVSTVLGASSVGKIPYRMTEYAAPNPQLVTVNEYVEAMFDAQFMLELASNGWAGANKWNAKNGGVSSTGGDWGFLSSTNNAPYPDYYPYAVLSGKFGSSQVLATSANSSVRSYAAVDASGNLTLFLVNNDPSTDISATVNVTGFSAAAVATKWVLLPQGNAPSGAPQEAAGLQINGVANPAPSDIASIAGVSQTGTNAFTVDLPPSAMVLIVVPPGC